VNTSEPKPTTDLLGVALYGEALKIGVQKTFDIAEQFLNDICRPAAGEVGLLLRDHVRAWRAKNLANIASKAKEHVAVTSEGVQLRTHRAGSANRHVACPSLLKN
jgi:hypothetical protein